MNLSLTQETENPIDAQRARSRAGYERTTRRFRKLGLLPQQLAERFPPIKREDWVTGAPACMSEPACGDCGSLFHGENSAACPQTFVTNIQAVKAALGIPAETKLQGFEPKGSSDPIPSFAFRIEYQCLVTKNWMPIADPKARANKASDLLPECQRLAKAHCGESMRFRIIRPLPGARAVHRIAARKNKRTGEIELYAWST